MQALLLGCFKYLAGCEPRWLTAGLARENYPSPAPNNSGSESQSELGGRLRDSPWCQRSKELDCWPILVPTRRPNQTLCTLDKSHSVWNSVLLSVKWGNQTLASQVNGRPMMLKDLIALSPWLYFGKLNGLPHARKSERMIQHHCSGFSQLWVGPYSRALPAFPPTPWPNSYGLSPYPVTWHGAYPGFGSHGLTHWVEGCCTCPFPGWSP